MDLKKNKDFLRLKHDLDERTRSRQNRKEKGPKQEVLYVDATRNVGVVLGEKDIGADMKKQVVKRYTAEADGCKSMLSTANFLWLSNFEFPT